MEKKTKGWVITILLLICIILVVRLVIQENRWICVNGAWVEHGNPKKEKPEGYCFDGNISNFKECVAAGNPVIESYPRQCTAENQTFKEVIENFCTQENGGDLCTTLYEPVCGYPLKETFSNSCFACQNSEVVYWVPGNCI